MFNPASRQNWNEFQWEKEIRKDELRINRYFQALRVCLDLPGEEEMIFKRLMSQQDLVPTGVEWSQQSLSEFYAQHDDEDEENPPDDFCHRAGYDLLRQLDRQAREWNVVFAAGLRGSFLREGLALTCRFGKLLSRFSNFIEIDDPEMRALKISLGKRVLADLNDIFGSLNMMMRRQKALQGPLMTIADNLQHVREATVDLLEELRNGDKK